MQINGTSSKNNYGFYALINEIIPDNYITTNKTIIEYHVYIKNNGTRFNSNSWTKYAQVDGTDVYRQTNQNIASNSVGFNDALEIISGTKEIEHATDGSKAITFSAGISKSSYGSYDPGTCNLSGQVVLTTIPRASIPSSSSGDIGTNVTIYTNRKSSSFTHTITYSFPKGSSSPVTGTIKTKTTDDNFQWTIPTSFYAKIPNSPNGICVLTCTTFNGSTQIGSAQTCEFTATANMSSNLPTITINAVDTNTTCTNLTGSNKKFIKYISNAQVTLAATAKNSATMKTTSIVTGDGRSISGNGNITTTFNNIETIVFNASGTDSRGYPNSNSVTGLSIVEYEKLTLNPVDLYRTSQTSNTLFAKGSGNYFNASFGSSVNSITFQYRYKESTATNWGNWTTKTVTTTSGSNGYSFDFQIGTNFNYQKIYNFEFKVSDKVLALDPQSASSKPGIPIMLLAEKIVEYWGVKTLENVNNKTRLNVDLIYPVGSIYMSVNATNPSTIFGGTWEAWGKGRVPVGIDTSQTEFNTVEKTGGSKAVTLTPAQTALKGHTHTFSWTGSHSHTLPRYHAETPHNGAHGPGQYGQWTDGLSTSNTTITVSGNTGNITEANATSAHTNLQPYITCYMWKRTK